MGRLRLLLVATLVFAACSGEGVLFAQTGVTGSYQPPRPTLSPWLNLYQRNSGPLDNYHSFVRPELQLQGTLRQQNTAIQSQDQDLRKLSGQFSDIEQGKSVHPTGTGSLYMEYSHFYDSRSIMGRSAGTRPRTLTRGNAGPSR
jgi:hypothetical protein